MPGIFISYRRTDTIAWAGRLFADLSGCFGKSQVFMDINGGIPRGSDFEQVLTNALSGCDALLALIGPEWVDCKRSDGRPRLDVPDDWVRNEIATALQRNITVMPVLFGDARLPEEAELPEDLRALRKRLAAEVSDTRWDYDVGELIGDLVKLTSLKSLASAKTGLLLLKDLMTKPAVADAVSRSKEVIANTYRQLRKLGLFKTIHDALHYIELQCLQPIQAVGYTSGIRPHKISFTGQSFRIRKAIQDDPEIDSALRDDIMDQLDVTTAAFEVAAAAPGSDTYAPLVSELNALLSSLPTRLDSGIVAAAEELKLDRLVELMKTVRSVLLAAVPEHGSELEPLVQGIDALKRLRDELGLRVLEHTRLQRLDSKLRTVCIGGTAPGALAGEWGRMKRVRSRLVPPFSPELSAQNNDLVPQEAEIEAAVGRGDGQAALGLLEEYFRSVRSVFQNVDIRLKDFCMELSDMSQPLKIILQMC